MPCRNYVCTWTNPVLCSGSVWVHCLPVTVQHTHSCSLQQFLFLWHCHSLTGEGSTIGNRFPSVFTAAKSFSEVQIPIPASYGQRIKAPVMPCGERGHGSTFVALRPNVGGTCSEIKEPGEVHHPISSIAFLLCPFVNRGHQNICLLCWNMFMFKGSGWTEHQGSSEPFEESHFLNRVTLESVRLFLSKGCITWKETWGPDHITLFHKQS